MEKQYVSFQVAKLLKEAGYVDLEFIVPYKIIQERLETYQAHLDSQLPLQDILMRKYAYEVQHNKETYEIEDISLLFGSQIYDSIEYYYNGCEEEKANRPYSLMLYLAPTIEELMTEIPKSILFDNKLYTLHIECLDEKYQASYQNEQDNILYQVEAISLIDALGLMWIELYQNKKLNCFKDIGFYDDVLSHWVKSLSDVKDEWYSIENSDKLIFKGDDTENFLKNLFLSSI